MLSIKDFKKAVTAGIWFMFLTFPILVIRVNTVENVVEWRWLNMVFAGATAFIITLLASFLMKNKQSSQKPGAKPVKPKPPLLQILLKEKRFYIPALVVIVAFILAFPFLFSMYQTTIMSTALIYVMLGLGLNIVIGLAGLLDLGYVAFYAVGAYSYALLNYHYGVTFWIALPIGGILGACFGIILGYPVLRLRGDYLAIVTLGFGEIIRLVLENWNAFSFGPSGISGIPRPPVYGVDLSLQANLNFIYYILIGLVVLTIFVVNRLQNSRIGRAWIALREDEIACQAMGIDKAKTKLTAFALGATWAGMGGVVFAAKTTFINPASFTIWESVMILCIVVLGGMGSIIGVIVGAMVLILLPEYLRAFSEYRMLIFGIMLVTMMVFRPGGIIPDIRKKYTFEEKSK